MQLDIRIAAIAADVEHEKLHLASGSENLPSCRACYHADSILCETFFVTV